MRRWLHRAPFLLATLWCAAVAAIWARSYSAPDTLGRLWATAGEGWWSENNAQLSSLDGVMQLNWAERVTQGDSEESRYRRDWTQRGFYRNWSPFDSVAPNPPGRTINVYDHASELPLPGGKRVPIGGVGGVAVPHWLVLLPGLAIAAATFGPARGNPRPRRWRRAFFHAALALPPLVLAGTVALWVNSRSVGYQWSQQRLSSDGRVSEKSQTTVMIGQDLLLVATTRTAGPLPPLLVGKAGPTSRSTLFYSQPLPPVPTMIVKTAPTYEYLGFSYTPGGNAPNAAGMARVVTAPLWALPLAVMPFAMWSGWQVQRARRRARRLRRGECVHCGYDLRATPGQCPECGAGSPGPPNDPTQSSSVAAGI
jgi:hypothetical protein